MTSFVGVVPPKKEATSYLEHVIGLAKDRGLKKPSPLSRIVCTIGPATASAETIEKMIAAGMNVARLNFSYGTHESHANVVRAIRQAVVSCSAKAGMLVSVAIALDTKGPEIRTGQVEGGPTAEVLLEREAAVTLTVDPAYEDKCTKDLVFVDYANITKVLRNGSWVYIDSGQIALVVVTIAEKEVQCQVQYGGVLGSRKTVNLPGTVVDLPTVSEKDKKDIRFAVEQRLDMIFASFVRDTADVQEIRSLLGEEGKSMWVVSKIENTQGIERINEIIEASDGIMVARGDMGIEIPPEKVFLAQKSIIARCNTVGKPVICATQMLESMIESPKATQAESSDVANAILDGADCVMLSDETAKGKFPIECIKTMAKVCTEAEDAIWHRQHFLDLKGLVSIPIDPTHTVAIAAVEAATKVMASAIMVITYTGRAATMLARYRPNCVIICVTRNEQVARQLQLYRALYSIYCEVPALSDFRQDVDVQIQFALSVSKRKRILDPGKQVVILIGSKDGQQFDNTIRIEDVV